MQVLDILLFGADGQVGWELRTTLCSLGRVIAVGRRQVDFTDPGAIRRRVRTERPAIIVNAAAYTAVDRAEVEPELAMAINGLAPQILAEEARRLGSILVHYSTDYVFDGTKASAYLESDEPAPLNVYGQTKLAGDKAIEAVGGCYLIFRTSWVYGSRGKNFLLTILRLAQEQSELRIVNDQIGAPTPSTSIARATAAVLMQVSGSPVCGMEKLSGIYNLTTAGETSWFGFASALISRISTNSQPLCRLMPQSSNDYKTPARRPPNSRLAGHKLAATFGLRLPQWDDALAEIIERLPEDVKPDRISNVA